MKVSKLKWSEMSDNEIQIVIESANNELAHRSKKKEAIAKVKAMMTEQLVGTGVTIEEVLGDTALSKARKVNKVAPKYRNPANPDETWTGRGRKPLWVIAYLDAGNTLDAIAID